MRTITSPIWLATVLLAGTDAPARAQWQVIRLQPDGADSSEVLAAAGARQGGQIEPADTFGYRPIIWNASADDCIDLLPQGAHTGIVHGMDGSWQVGEVYFDYSNPRAALWSGSPDSFVDLTPTGSSYSVALGICAEQQVGYVGPGGPLAALWFGTAQSYVNLHPSSARWSEAWATDGPVQGGRASFPALGEQHAVLWKGSPQSFIDMNPAGARDSIIRAMAAGVQVGKALFGTTWHAVLWRGSPESWQSLHPPGASNSSLFDTTGTIHVGNAYLDTGLVAGVWLEDDVESFANLHPYLGPGWWGSTASAVSVQDGHVYIGGAALPSDGDQQAVLWIGRLPGAEGPPMKVLPEQIFPIP